ncbi:DUF3592 domain-containing protein [Streptomyces sp. NPDC002795]|uniref:DUF3592 domain-containing protein n=1 Tax=Streptomyces sp. NPDC002795 TaxID=3364665 RepID=UPI0036B85BB7
MQVQVRGRTVRRWVVAGVSAFGGIFLVVGLILTWSSVSLLREADRTTGRVVALQWRDADTGSSRTSRGRDEPSAYPVVEFATTDGTAHTFRSSTGSNPPSYEEGERVEVLYRADAPEDARINGFLSLWLLPLIFGGIGLIAAAVATGIAVFGRRRA